MSKLNNDQETEVEMMISIKDGMLVDSMGNSTSIGVLREFLYSTINYVYKNSPYIQNSFRRDWEAIERAISKAPNVKLATESLECARESLVGCVLECENCGEDNDVSDLDAVIYIDRALKALELPVHRALEALRGSKDESL